MISYLLRGNPFKRARIDKTIDSTNLNLTSRRDNRTMTCHRILLYSLALLTLCSLVSAYENCHSILPPGGFLREMPADDDSREVLKDVQFVVEKKLGKSIESLTALSYRNKVIGSLVWIIKADLVHDDGTKLIVHIKIHQPQNGDAKVLAIRSHVCPGDPIEVFSRDQIWRDK